MARGHKIGKSEKERPKCIINAAKSVLNCAINIKSPMKQNGQVLQGVRQVDH